VTSYLRMININALQAVYLKRWASKSWNWNWFVRIIISFCIDCPPPLMLHLWFSMAQSSVC